MSVKKGKSRPKDSSNKWASIIRIQFWSFFKMNVGLTLVFVRF